MLIFRKYDVLHNYIIQYTLTRLQVLILNEHRKGIAVGLAKSCLLRALAKLHNKTGFTYSRSCQKADQAGIIAKNKKIRAAYGANSCKLR